MLNSTYFLMGAAFVILVMFSLLAGVASFATIDTPSGTNPVAAQGATLTLQSTASQTALAITIVGDADADSVTFYLPLAGSCPATGSAVLSYDADLGQLSC